MHRFALLFFAVSAPLPALAEPRVGEQATYTVTTTHDGKAVSSTRLAEIVQFDDDTHRRRLSVKPGLTCLWQISGRNEVKSFKEWVRLDLEYIDNWSLWLDLKILLPFPSPSFWKRLWPAAHRAMALLPRSWGVKPNSTSR